VKELGDAGFDAAGFAADVRDPAALTQAIVDAVEKYGDIDFVYYGPSPHNITDTQKSIEAIGGSDIQDSMTSIYPAADVVATLLPSMLERRAKGVFLFTSAISAVLPVPALGAMTVPAAASRSYAATLNAALAPKGIYAGVLLIGGLIDHSDIQKAMSAGSTDTSYLLDPDRVADIAWELTTRRTTPEALIMPGHKTVGLTLLLIGRLLKIFKRGASPRKSR
jgi:NADP-dependent 3-hydroxy acid dehydrogenase YdfG